MVTHFMQPDAEASRLAKVPRDLPILPLRNTLAYPFSVLPLDGYTEHEKVHIAQHYLIPRHRQASGLRLDEITFLEAAIRKIIRDYTREAGVRSLERQLSAICRKVAVRIAAQEVTQVTVTPDMVRAYLRKEPFFSEVSEYLEIPGIAGSSRHGGGGQHPLH